MNTKNLEIRVSGLSIQIVRKNIKNLHLGVYPPNGRVRVAAPLALSDDAVRLAVISRLAWIKRQRAKFEGQTRQSKREMVTGESHYFLGQRYRLRVVNHDGAARVAMRNKSTIELHVRQQTTVDQRERLLQRWYRQQLKVLIPPLLGKWQTALGVQVADWGVKKMKTKWGSCNIGSHRVWFNLELVKKPVQCLEYIVVHELTHLLEKHHSDRFVALMEQHLPTWRVWRDMPNHAPLAHENWSY
ncbi:MAG: SprT family zinc-dependent metalloprotease [Thermodesulfobacteriota bacterium]|nr:SprT family zinc-dependent metalloprotease [Thermodesulfobacteriota bacterium]